MRSDELEKPYRHPYRFWLPQVWRRSHATPLTTAGVLCAIGGAILEQTSDVDGWLTSRWPLLSPAVAAALQHLTGQVRR